MVKNYNELVAKNMPTIYEMVSQLNLPLLVSPNDKSAIKILSLEILLALSKLESWKWAKIHWRIIRWYDQCYKELHKNGHVFTYPVVTDQQMDYMAFIKKELDKAPILRRVAQLLWENPALTKAQMYEILKAENYKPHHHNIVVALHSMYIMLAWLDEQHILKEPLNGNNTQTD